LIPIAKLRMKISFIIDNPDSWFHDYASILIPVLKKYDRSPRYLKNGSEIKKGDILFILSCDKLLKKEELSRHKNNIVVHAADLPRDRGWSPLTWQVERGKNKITVTLFEASADVDAGKYYLKDKIELNGTELIDEIREKQAKRTIKMIKEYLSRYPMKAKPQRGRPSHNRKRRPEDYRLDLNKSIASQFNKMRVADNERYPLYFIRGGVKYILKVYKDKKKQKI